MQAACAQREPSFSLSFPPSLSIHLSPTVHLSPSLSRTKKWTQPPHVRERGGGDWVSPVIIAWAAVAAAAQWRQWAAVQRANRPRPSHIWTIDQCDSEMTARGNRTALLRGDSVLYPRCQLPCRDVRTGCGRLKRTAPAAVRDWDSSVVRERATWCGFFRFT